MARILVVDDDAGIRELIGATLELEGHEIEKHPDGQSCIDAYPAAPADLAIVDIVMPGRDGIETIRSLRSLDASVRIIAISGQGSGGLHSSTNLEAARKLGADVTIEKPFGAARLREVVGALLAS